MVVPAGAKAARHVTRALMREGAMDPGTARPMDGLSFVGARALRRLVERGVVRQAEPGLYWLDGAAYEAWHAERMARVRWALLVVLAALLVGAGLSLIR